MIHDALDRAREFGPKGLTQVHGRDGNVGRLGVLILPGHDLARSLLADGRCLGAIPDELGHFHDTLVFAAGRAHRKELIGGQADALWVRVGVGPVGKHIHTAARTADTGLADGGIKEGPVVPAAVALHAFVQC